MTATNGVTNPLSIELGTIMTPMDISTGDSDKQSEDANAVESPYARFAHTASWAVNWLLFIIKIIAFVISGSKVIVAALTDSAVDLISQFLLSYCTLYMGAHSPEYPVGRSRLEALSVLGCASIMIFASVEVIQFSIVDIIDGCNGKLSSIVINSTVYSILAIGIGLKVLLYLYCVWANVTLRDDQISALAEDHLNDVWSNTTAIIAISIAYNVHNAWWVDPAAAILVSLIIIIRWCYMMEEQIRKIVGYTAPQEFIEQVEDIARNHDSRIKVDCVRAYHFGARFNVEMEIILPGAMSVIESHDISLELQHKIESLTDVERSFVHVDHQERDGLEHKVERELVRKHTLKKEFGSNTNASTSSSVQINNQTELRIRGNQNNAR